MTHDPLPHHDPIADDLDADGGPVQDHDSDSFDIFDQDIASHISDDEDISQADTQEDPHTELNAHNDQVDLDDVQTEDLSHDADPQHIQEPSLDPEPGTPSHPDTQDEWNRIQEIRNEYTRRASEVDQAYHDVSAFLASLVPPEPSLSLAREDPSSYQYQVALRRKALDELGRFQQRREALREDLRQSHRESFQRYRDDQEAKLREALPELKQSDRLAAFRAENKKTALKFGFSEEEIDSTCDHRILQLVHYARIGKVAEHNRKNATRRLAEKPKRKAWSQNTTVHSVKNQKAMHHLTKIGSVEAAMAVEFE